MSSLPFFALRAFLIFVVISVSASFNATDETPDDYYRFTRNGMIQTKYRWKNFFMFLDPEFNDNERKIIQAASTELQKVLPCVKFWIWPKGKSPSSGFNEAYIHVKKVANGCSADVGKTKTTGAQALSLGARCVSLSIVLHEMIHALGFHHEQSQPDRDKYVKIIKKNVEDGKFHNFVKYTNKEVTTFGVPYNHKSLMHYSSKDFSKVGQPTILTKDGKIIERNTVLQKSDILKLKRMYKC